MKDPYFKGFLTLSMSGQLRGWTPESIAPAKPEHVFLESLYKRWWVLNTADRLSLMQILVEATALGLTPAEKEYWEGPQAWNIQEADCVIYSGHAGVKLTFNRNTGRHYATYLADIKFEGKEAQPVGYKADGADYWEAICKLFKLMRYGKPEQQADPEPGEEPYGA